MRAVDPQAEGILEAVRDSPPLDEVGVEAARRWIEERPPRVFEVESAATVEDRQVGESAEPLRLRLYRPLGVTETPVVVFAHSGGWIMGSAVAGDPFCRRFAERSGCTVISVDYRLAPEFPYPAPLDDVVDAVIWAAQEASAEGFVPGRICVAGESSGGCLAAAACLRIRDEGIADVALQLLVCPVIDPGMETDSWRELGNGFIPASSQMAWMWDLYAPAEKQTSQYVAPVAAERLDGLPKTIVLTSEFDPLRDEAEQYVARIAAAGGDAESRRYEGQIHAVFSYAALVDRCREILDEIAVEVGSLLRPS